MLVEVGPRLAWVSPRGAPFAPSGRFGSAVPDPEGGALLAAGGGVRWPRARRCHPLTTRRSRPQPSATIVSKVAPSGAREWAALDAERLITLAPRDAAAPAPPAGANDKHLIFSTVNG